MSYLASAPAAGAHAAAGLRSVLFVPGSNERAIDKALASEADAIVLDLEDMVAPADKPAARERVAEFARAGGAATRTLVVRVNGLDTAWGADDIAAVAGVGADALLLPKIDEPAMLDDCLGRIDAAGGGESAVWMLAETARGIQHIDAIVRGAPRLRAIVMGTEDLHKSVGIGRDAARTGLLYALSRCVFAANAGGIAAIDGVHLAVKDEDGFAAACRQGKMLGFSGKALIHPLQIAAANAVFGGREIAAT